MRVLVFVKFYTNSAGFLFRLVESNRCVIILIMGLIHIFQYGVIFNRMIYLNVDLRNKALLIVVLLFLKEKIRKDFRCDIYISKDFLKLNYLKSYLCQLISKFLNFSRFYVFLVKFFCVHMKCVFALLYNAVSFILIVMIFLCQYNSF